jgi:hypothetical protein
MRITESRIRQIIREETSGLLKENEDFDPNTGMPSSVRGVAMRLKGILSKASVSGNDSKLVKLALDALDPAQLAAAKWLQVILNEINNEAVGAEMLRGRNVAFADTARRMGQEAQVMRDRQKIVSYDPDTGKPVYGEGRRRDLSEGRSPSSVFEEIRDICDEALMNKSLGVKAGMATSYKLQIMRALSNLSGDR